MTNHFSVPRWVAACGALLATGAWGAGLPLSSDFESGTVLTSDTPPGAWDRQTAPAGCSNEVLSAAAHRGSFGYRAIDMDTTSGAGDQGKVLVNLSVTTGAVYSRCWFRIVSAANVGAGAEVFVVTANIMPVGDLVSLQLFGPGTSVGIQGRDRTGAFIGSATTTALDVGAWYLLETAATGLGTSAGSRALYVNGALAASSTGIDWSGSAASQITGLVIGENYADQRSASVTLDYDDVRVDTRPLASKLAISTPMTAPATACTPLTLSLVDSIAGATAAAPYDVVVAVALTGVSGALYGDASCSTAAATVTLPAASSSAQVYLRAADPGAAAVKASHADFLPGEAQIELQPGGPDGPRERIEYRLSCSAGGAGLALWPLALAALGAWRRRRQLTSSRKLMSSRLTTSRSTRDISDRSRLRRSFSS